jgi:UDP-N-acetylglucosamine 2-epimerase
MKIATVVGARPQFIKAAPISQALQAAGHQEYLIHTGQHYDHGMSQVFFEELGLPEPDINLGVGSGTHGWQTGQILMRLEAALIAEKPDRVLVYGDTNSTLAGALAAVKLHIPVAHVEAGLRSFNREMPEEYNRVLTDHCADLLFCPTQTAVENLAREGITKGVFWVGDTMYDAVLQFAEIAQHRSTIMKRLGLEPKHFLLATVHRPYNTDDPAILDSILTVFREQSETIVFPVHPRTRACIEKFGLISPGSSSNLSQPCAENMQLRLIDPVGYLDMLVLEQNARLILTDSGGMQKEAYFFGVPCLTLRPETEWVETVEAGWNILVGVDPLKIALTIKEYSWPTQLPPPLFGNGDTASRICSLL